MFYRYLYLSLFSLLISSCVNDSNPTNQVELVDPVVNTYLNQIGFEVFQSNYVDENGNQSKEHFFRMETEDIDCPYPQIVTDITLNESSLSVFIWRVEFVEHGFMGCGPGSRQISLPFSEGNFTLNLSNFVSTYLYDVTLESGNIGIELLSIENESEHDFFVIGYPN